MSQLSTAHGLWFRRVDATPARERLRRTVAALTRARRLQLLVDHAFGGLLAGLVLAAVAVLSARLLPLPYPPWQLGGAAVMIALAVALLAGWLRRPDALAVAIRADLIFKMKQRLSTAWEFMTVDDNGELAERLAVQAVKSGLPPRPGLVFPLRVNRWGRLVPLAATALLLTSVLDLNWLQAPASRQVDGQVVSEGQRLGAVGRAMQARAMRGELARSARHAAQLERLGARMESGALSRGEALADLRQMGELIEEDRRQALGGAKQGDGLRPGNTGRSAAAPGPDQGAMPGRALGGALPGEDTRSAAGGMDERLPPGIPSLQPEEKPRADPGADKPGGSELRAQLTEIDRARMDHDELENAGEEVRRSRVNLGESLANTGGERRPAARADAAGAGQRGGDGAADNPPDGGQAQAASRSGSPGGGASGGGRRQPSPLGSDAGQSGPIIKPQSQLREGEVLVSPGWVLPRRAGPTVENVQMNREFESQVEEVMSREEYPAHYKEFIRRYFLSLSQGVPGPQQQPSGER